MKYLNATTSVSSAGGDVAGFGGDASVCRGDGLGAPNNGDTRVGLSVGVDCVGLNAVSDAEDTDVDTGDGWAVKVNGLDVEVPAPKPTKAPNLGGGTVSWVGYGMGQIQNTRLTHDFLYIRSRSWWQSIENWWL